MPGDNSEVKNASGIVAHETKSLKERNPEPHEQKLIDAIKELYTCKPTESTFNVYTKNAVFHDPVGIAQGVESIKAQFYGLTKLFPRADVPRFRILENPPSLPKNKILIDQDVAYFRDPNASAPTKIMRHTEEWDHKREATAEDEFAGMLNEHRKKATATITGIFMSEKK